MDLFMIEERERAMTGLYFHQSVITPCGPGIIQGQMRVRGELRVLVSHQPGNSVAEDNMVVQNLIRGIWTLAAYLPEDVRGI